MARGNGRFGQATGGTLGIAADDLRRHNLTAILEQVHLDGPVSRSHLTATTGLNRSTVADLTGELTGLGLVSEGPATIASGPGRPSLLVDVVPQGAVVIAVEIAVDSLAVATVGIGGHVFDQIRVGRARGHLPPDQTMRDIAQLAGPLVRGLPVGSNVVGIGTAIVGITRRSDGFVHLAPNLGWKDVNLGSMLGDALSLDVPVLVANDADLGALGEYMRGGRRGVGHLAFVSGEVGIGCGFVVDGEPLLGSAGYSGEAGHMLINPEGRRCACGATGCWETEAGEGALLRRVGGLDGVSGLTALDVVEERALAGDRATLEALEETGRWLGYGIRNLINLLNPELIVLGGMYDRFFEYFEHTATQAIAGAVDASRAMVTITRSKVGSEVNLLGAAELAMGPIIADPASAIPD